MPDNPQRGGKRPGRARAGGAAAAGGSVRFPVVGIGASAGGLEALNTFLEAMPGDSGMAFVVVLHLDPTHESQIPALLGRRTAMPVVEIKDGMAIEPNRVHVIAPDEDLTISNGRLRFKKPREPRGRRRPVDVFFSSLVESVGERAICIVMSGTGSNGTQALREVKAGGGLTIAQAPETARFDGMPCSAINAGVIDHVLPPEAMPEVILRYGRHAYVAAPDTPHGDAAFEQILALVRARTGRDFRSYKKSTLQRRIQRRMGLGNSADPGTYLERLRDDPPEVKALIRDLMISVTGFFRDADAWVSLERTVIAPLVAARPHGAPIRVWVPACATGEEAYSVTMLILEAAEDAGKQFDLKVFATDAEDTNLTAARAGTYPDAAVVSIPAARLRRFFDRLDGAHQVTREVREAVVFAPQDLLRDPPFSQLDLVSCRNLLIYLEPEVQQKILTMFHFALKEDGFLFLGSAETVGRLDDIYDAVAKKWRIYRRVGPARRDLVDYPMFGAKRPAQPASEGLPPPAAMDDTRAAEVARRMLLERYAPAAVLIDRKFRALYFHGATSDYLRQPGGEPTRDLLAMARDELRTKLRGAVRQAIASGAPAAFSARMRNAQDFHPVSVTVSPVSPSSAQGGPLLVSFEQQGEPSAPPEAAAAPDSGAGHGIEQQFEEELRATRAELQSTIEQLEGVNEELKAANEEGLSVNEELQSANEELETSKEEMQSYNEELHTINTQLQAKLHEIEEKNNDLDNLLAGTDVATIFLDSQLRIKWFSPATKELLDLVSSDIGRRIASFAPKFADAALTSDAERVLARLVSSEVEVSGDAGRWYLRRMIPYRTRDNRISGVVVTFIDITERKRAQDSVNEARLYAEAIVETIRQPLLVLDETLRVVSANRRFYEAFAVAREATEGRLLYELGNSQWDGPELRQLLKKILTQDKPIEGFQVEKDFMTLGHRIVRLDARKLARGGGRPALILLAIEDITARTQAETREALLKAELSHRVKNTLATVQAIASQTLRRGASPEAFHDAFTGRIQALSRAHELLVKERWTGSDLNALAERMLDAYQRRKGRQVTIAGPTVKLSPQRAFGLAMILHELATNAAKYGALSVPAGRVELRWALERKAHLRLHWIESGGPRVVPPSSGGFGTAFIERCATYELGGHASLTFSKGGVRCVLRFPLAPPEAAAGAGPQASIAGA